MNELREGKGICHINAPTPVIPLNAHHKSLHTELHFSSSRNWPWLLEEFSLQGCCCSRKVFGLYPHCCLNNHSIQTVKKNNNSGGGKKCQLKWLFDFFGLPTQSERSLLEPCVNTAWFSVSWVTWQCYFINPHKVSRVKWQDYLRA